MAIDALGTELPGRLALAEPVRRAMATGGWQIRAEISRGDAAAVAEAISAAIAAGADATAIQPAWPGSRGAGVIDAIDARVALAPAHAASHPIYIHAGALASPWLAARLFAAEGYPQAAMRGGVLASPIATLAAEGCLPGPLDRAIADCASAFSVEQARELDLLSCSALPAHDAGADAATSIALVLAQLAEYGRRFDAAGVPAERWLRRTWLEIGVDGDVLEAAAATRALRACHARLCAAIGVRGVRARIAAHCTRRGATRHDAPTNLLRATAEATAAAIGGADAITIRPWDHALGGDSRAAERLTVTMQAVLRREGRIGDVADPCAGAYFLETLTDAIAREAFNIWQELEAGGGILPALRDGALQRRIAVQRADVLAAIASRSVAIVGVSVSPAATVAASGSGRDDVALPFAADALASIQDVGGARDALRIGATIAAVEASIARCGDDNDAEVCTPLCAMRWATGWEVLRQRLDGLGDAAPLVFLAALGPPNRHKGRLDFARELFTAGGFRVAEGPSGANVESIATALTASGCDGVAICGHDDDVARSALALCAEVQRFAPRFIAVMGRPRAAEAELRIAGVNHFVFLGSDVLAQLNACAQRCGAGEGSRP